MVSNLVSGDSTTATILCSSTGSLTEPSSRSGLARSRTLLSFSEYCTCCFKRVVLSLRDCVVSGSRVDSAGLRESREFVETLTVSNSGASNKDRLSSSFNADSVRLDKEASEFENSSRVELTPVSSWFEELSNSANSIVSTSSSNRFSSGLESNSC